METKTKKPDLRVKKTKRLIHNAVATLMKEKEISSITVKEVAEVADINRKTFYNYYANVGQVVSEIEDEVVEALDSTMRDIDLQMVLHNPSGVFQKLIEVMSRNPEISSCLMEMNSNVSLVTKVADEIKARAGEHYIGQVSISRERLDLILEYEFNGMFSAFRKWFNSDRSLSLEEVSHDISLTAIQGFGGFVKG